MGGDDDEQWTVTAGGRRSTAKVGLSHDPDSTAPLVRAGLHRADTSVPHNDDAVCPLKRERVTGTQARALRKISRLSAGAGVDGPTGCEKT